MVRSIELLKNRNTSALLDYFLQRPTKKIHAGRLEKEVKIYRKGILDGLRELRVAGLLEMEEAGRTKQYCLNRGNPVVKQLKILFTLDKVMPLVEKFGGNGVEAYLYGSCARGEDTEESDIDLLFIGNVKRTEVLGKFGGMDKLKPVYFTFLEYSMLARKDKPFYERLEKDRIRLI